MRILPMFFPDMESPDCFSSSSSPIKSNTSSPFSKHHNTPPGSKSPGFTQTRKPAVGSSRPLPSPGRVQNYISLFLLLQLFNAANVFFALLLDN